MLRKLFFPLAILLFAIPRLAGAAPGDLPQDSAGKTAALAWIKANYKPNMQLTRNVIADVQKFDDSEQNLRIVIGPTALKSAKGVDLWIYDGQFFLFPMSPKQFQGAGLKLTESRRITRRRSDSVSDNPVAELSDLKVEKISESDGSFQGSLHYKRLRGSPDQLLLSASFPLGGGWVFSIDREASANLPKDALVHFKFRGLKHAERQASPFAQSLPQGE